MKITPYLSTLYLPPPKVPRSKGIHVSGLIRGIAIEAGIWKADTEEEPSISDIRAIVDPIAIARITLGLAWEEWYIHNMLTEVVDHPDEMCVDGVYLSPDGEGVDTFIYHNKPTILTVLHEVKLTWKSVNTVSDMESQWAWLTQIKAYCYSKKCLHARIHVYFVCGNYKHPISPMLKCWDLEFTQKELDLNWSMLIEYRDDRLERERERNNDAEG